MKKYIFFFLLFISVFTFVNADWVTIFSDNFNDGSINSNLWEVNLNSGTVVEAGGYLALDGAQYFPKVTNKVTIPKSKKIRTTFLMKYDDRTVNGDGLIQYGACNELIGQVWNDIGVNRKLLVVTNGGSIITIPNELAWHTYVFERSNNDYTASADNMAYISYASSAGCSTPIVNPSLMLGHPTLNEDGTGSGIWTDFSVDWINVECYSSTEIYDGWDNDCDGLVDEGFCTSGSTRSCGTDVGECSFGIETCSSGVWGNCTAVGPTQEVCEGLKDEDCDGVVDNGCDCTIGSTRSCGTDVGECSFGIETCSSGIWRNCTAIEPSDEFCDGKDNDCSGASDDGPGMECIFNEIGCDNVTCKWLPSTGYCLGNMFLDANFVYLDENIDVVGSVSVLLVDSNTSRKCEAICDAGYHRVDQACIADVGGSCIGPIKSDTNLCADDAIDLGANDVTRSLIGDSESDCTDSKKCEYYCNDGFFFNGSECEESILTPVGPNDGSCEIDYFEVENVYVGDPVKITYACSSLVDINIILFDSSGNQILTSVYSNSCTLDHKVYAGYTFISNEQVAVARINTNNCMKEKFFTVKVKKEAAIPDNNLFLVLFVALISLVIITNKKVN